MGSSVSSGVACAQADRIKEAIIKKLIKMKIFLDMGFSPPQEN
jgi:hypothetical protein